MTRRPIAAERLLNVIVVAIALLACGWGLRGGHAAGASSSLLLRPADLAARPGHPDFRERARASIDRRFADRAAIARCIADVESGWRPDARNRNEDGSVDRGLFQINSRWHAALADDQAFDLDGNVAYAFALSSAGTDWSAWSPLTRARCGLE